MHFFWPNNMNEYENHYNERSQTEKYTLYDSDGAHQWKSSYFMDNVKELLWL